MSFKRIILVMGVLIASLALNNAAQSAILKAGEKILLFKEGDGLWDVKAFKGGEVAAGKAVDNDGCLYVSDTFGNRILVFTAEEEPWRVITIKGLRHPAHMEIDENDNLFVNGITNDGRANRIQYIVS